MSAGARQGQAVPEREIIAPPSDRIFGFRFVTHRPPPGSTDRRRQPLPRFTSLSPMFSCRAEKSNGLGLFTLCVSA